ncbi:HET domain protein [Halenospora varia]|nr:HET domain protein [Halenospora varia]
MRLINTSTMQLEEFMGNTMPKYAILSHTWLDDEVSLQDYANMEKASKQKGFAKIKLTCDQAQKTGIQYAWVDTCCIDKTSSAELTEAINSMYQWYEYSAVCYVYLPDLSPEDLVDAKESCSRFAKSRWFTRGWTLQELIAPKVVEFYDSTWNFRGTKADLCEAISIVTAIDEEVLRDSSLLYNIPVARRMSWAARRQTTRLEDIAYSLLGIFDVNMPMLYGEGEKAFIRLQAEIAKEMNDLTLFAWKSNESTPQDYRGILARSPAEFADAGSVIPVTDHRFADEFTLTNKGLRITAELAQGSRDNYVLSLNCYPRGAPEQKIGIYLKHYGASVYARDNPAELAVQREFERAMDAKVIYITKNIIRTTLASTGQVQRHAIHLRHGFEGKFPTVLPAKLWDSQRKLYLTQGLSTFAGLMYFHPKAYPKELLIIACGMSGTSEPWVVFLNRLRMKAISPCFNDPNQLFKLDKTCFLEKDIIFGTDSKAKQFSVSISLQDGNKGVEPMYCIDVHEDVTMPGELPTMQKYRKWQMAEMEKDSAS